MRFFLKLNPPRPTFAQDMNDSERKIMLDHVTYWKGLGGIVIVLGPVLDPKGAYGIAVIEVKDEDEARRLVKNDPVSQAKFGKYEIFPMRT